MQRAAFGRQKNINIEVSAEWHGIITLTKNRKALSLLSQKRLITLFKICEYFMVHLAFKYSINELPFLFRIASKTYPLRKCSIVTD